MKKGSEPPGIENDLCIRDYSALLMSAHGSPVSTQHGCKSMLLKILLMPSLVAAQNMSLISALAMSVAAPSAQRDGAVAL